MTKIFSTFLLIPLALFGQVNNFDFHQQDSLYVGTDDFVVQHGEIINLIDEAQELVVTRVTHQIPATWTCSFCVGSACLPPFLDQHTFTLEANDTSDFSLDTYPNGELGTGMWTIFAENSSTGEIDSVHITLTYGVVSVKDDRMSPGQFKLSPAYPNPTNAYINFDLDVIERGAYTLTLFSLDGREILTRSYDLRSGHNKIQWQLDELNSGSFLLVAEGFGQRHTQKVSVIK